MRKVVLVTGAARGLGNILANDLASHGYRVYGGTRAKHEPKGDLFSPVTLDLTIEENVQGCVDTIMTTEGRIDVVIHNAGLLYAGAPDSFTLEEMRCLFEVNVLGPVRLTQLLLPHMRNQNQGHIIFISSIRGIESHVYRGLYSATKAAIESIAFDWAVALARWNINVTVIEPGPLSTSPSVIEGSYFDQTTNPYPQIRDFKFVWQSPDEIPPIIRDVLDNPAPLFRYQTNVATKELISSHLIDETGQTWLNEQKKWYNESI